MSLNNIKIHDFSGDIVSVGETINQVNSFKKDGEIIQFLNADGIVSHKHIVHGVNQAFNAFSRGENLANDIGVEILLRCSAQRQISKAFEILGLKKGYMNLCAVLINCSDDYLDELLSMFSRCDKFSVNEDYLFENYNIDVDCLSNFTIEELIIDKITKLTVDY